MKRTKVQRSKYSNIKVNLQMLLITSKRHLQLNSMIISYEVSNISLTQNRMK